MKIINLKRLKKSNFVRYMVTGIIATILSTALLWFFVDIMHLPAYLIGFLVSTFIFFFKFIFHIRTLKVFRDEKRIFTRYVIISMIIVLLNTLLLWILVDMLRFSVIIMNPLILIFTFLFRYYLFKIFSMLQ